MSLRWNICTAICLTANSPMANYLAANCPTANCPVTVHKSDGRAELQKIKNERDLGVNILADFSLEMLISDIVRTAYAIANVRVAFRHMDKEMFRNICVTYSRDC
ncbi:hypothetical protein SK128_000540 [Halocaridina rubra]|uniref:Uncharacterized protein n=1 Tax=Halocaridina rubra TaxID=373956 RepID=A0AAN8ZVL3_HALRR